MIKAISSANFLLSCFSTARNNGTICIADEPTLKSKEWSNSKKLNSNCAHYCHILPGFTKIYNTFLSQRKVYKGLMWYKMWMGIFLSYKHLLFKGIQGFWKWLFGFWNLFYSLLKRIFYFNSNLFRIILSTIRYGFIVNSFHPGRYCWQFVVLCTVFTQNENRFHLNPVCWV